jgi:hypothetical protein
MFRLLTWLPHCLSNYCIFLRSVGVAAPHWVRRVTADTGILLPLAGSSSSAAAAAAAGGSSVEAAAGPAAVGFVRWSHIQPKLWRLAGYR